MAAEHVQCRPRDEVAVGIERDVVGAFALVAEFAIEWVVGGGDGVVVGNMQLEPDRETYPEDVEARTWRAWVG